MFASNTSTATEEERALEKIISMILRGLPVKSLIRFKCASKSFRRTISSPEFFIVHYLYSKLKRCPQLLFRMYGTFIWEGSNFRLVYKFCWTNLLGKVLSTFFLTLRQDPIRLVLPSSFGLFCIATGKGIWLCNPSFREYYELPPCPSLNPGDDRLLGLGFGCLFSLRYLGFKAVLLLLRQNTTCSSSPMIDCWVFSLTSPGGLENSSWRLMRERCPYLVPEHSKSAFSWETIYWMIDRRLYSKLSRDDDFLVAFNIREEKFRVIAHPVRWTYTADSKVHIAEINGRLFMVEILDCCVNMWFLRHQNDCTWSCQRRIRTTSHAPGRPVRVAELKYYDELHKIYVFSSSEENVMLLYGKKQGTLKQVVLPFNAIDFTTYFEGLYSRRN